MNSLLIIACNAGSASYKFALFESREGIVTQIGRLYFHWQKDGVCFDDTRIDLPPGLPDLDPLPERAGFQSWLLKVFLAIAENYDSMGFVHRLVHGGDEFIAPILATPEVMTKLHQLVPLAPLHLPANLALVELIEQASPDTPQLLCFDTAFHQTNAPLQQIVPLPEALRNQGVRRFGFHGLSYDYIAATLKQAYPDWEDKKQVYAHLGSGASLCAVHQWRSVDTSMGFSTIDGLPMATRPGSLDPGILLYLIQQGYDSSQLENLLYHQCGMLGISGESGDMQKLLQSNARDAHTAVDYFCWKCAQGIAQMMVSLGGMDVLVFTGGIGEHQPEVIRRVCQQLAFIGLQLKETIEFTDPINRLSTAESGVEVLSLPTNEERMMANNFVKCLGQE